MNQEASANETHDAHHGAAENKYFEVIFPILPMFEIYTKNGLQDFYLAMNKLMMESGGGALLTGPDVLADFFGGGGHGGGNHSHG